MQNNVNFKTLFVQQSDGVLNVTLNRPDSFNSMNRQMVDELKDLFTGLNRDDTVRVVILGGAGKHFCAGLDLKQSGTTPEPATVGEQLDRQRNFAEIYLAMRRCPQPVIAKVRGAASGGGMALALSADIRIMTPDARMNAAFIRLGLSGCDMGVSYFLPRLLGPGIAAELLLTGRFMSAERAERLGLANMVVASDQLDAEAEAFAADMMRATPLGLRLTKDGLNQSVDASGLDAVMALEDRNQMLALRDDNFREGMTAFLEKRDPVYK